MSLQVARTTPHGAGVPVESLQASLWLCTPLSSKTSRSDSKGSVHRALLPHTTSRIRTWRRSRGRRPVRPCLEVSELAWLTCSLPRSKSRTPPILDQHGMVWYGMVWYGMVWYGMVWYGMVWYRILWYVTVL